MKHILSMDDYVNPQFLKDIATATQEIIKSHSSEELDSESQRIEYDKWAGEEIHIDLPQDFKVINIFNHNGDSIDFANGMFAPIATKLLTLPGLFMCQLILIGQGSAIQQHVDEFERSTAARNFHYNVLIGLDVPSTDIAMVGVQVSDEQVSHDNLEAIIFDSQCPHLAWNYTNKMWISILFYLDKQFFKKKTNEDIIT